MSSPTKIPPDSEKFGERNRARRWNKAVRPGVPSELCLIFQLYPLPKVNKEEAEGGGTGGHTIVLVFLHLFEQ
jgi:hypothetical protein